MIKGMWNYAVKTGDLERTTRFYLECLGAELRISSEVLGCTYNLIRVGETRLILFDKAPYEEPLGIELPDGFLHVVYEVDDFESQIRTLRESGIEFLMGPQIVEGEFGVRKFAFFEAPGGVRTEVMQILEDTGKA